MGPGELNLLRQRAAHAVEEDQVWLAALQSLLDDTPTSYTPHALKDVLVEWDNGPKRGHDELVEKDGRMVYMQVGSEASAVLPTLVSSSSMEAASF